MSKVVLGIDIGGTSVKASACVDGRWAWVGQSGFYAKPDAYQLRAAIREAVAEVDDASAIGLCVPGLMNDDRSRVTFAVNVPGLVDLPLKELVPSALGWRGARPVVIANDAAAAAQDVYTSRKLTGRLLLLTLGTGVGSIVLDEGGVVLDVENGTSGHLGQIDVSIPGHDVVGPDGGEGGLEGYIGVPALRRAYGNDVSAAISHFSGDEPPMLALVRGLRIAHAIYRPHHICLCGGVGIRLTPLLPRLKSMVDLKLTSLARQGYSFTAGEDDFHAARGAARLAAQL
jgi:predicted NBD/HSP70 family sugar kinase